MKKICLHNGGVRMTGNFLKPIFVSLFAILAFQSISAQTDRDAAVAAAGDKYVISAKAGGVNYVEGSVSVLRKDGKSGYLTRRDQIDVGDVVTTGPDSKAEILLNPGSFLRLGSNSSFEFKTTSLDDLRVRLDSGSAIFEVFASRDFKVRVITPRAKLLLIKSGVFRIDVMANGGANIEVTDGEALLGDSNATLLKSGFAAKLMDRTATVQKFDRKDRDEFEAWSRTRSKELAKQSARLKNQSLRNSLLNSFNSGGWGMYNSFGLWVFNPFYGGYCFLPFGDGWASPYGFGYGSCLCNYHMPIIVYHPPTGGSGGGSGGTPTATLTPIRTQGDRSPTPPFVRMQQGSSGRGVIDYGGRPADRSPQYSDVPVYTPPPPPVVVSAPSADRASTGSRPHN
ncbi:MAG: FecR domain-containing protein [Acidobacteriota bacterium]